jgi:ABC-type transporter Mla MlaB component
MRVELQCNERGCRLVFAGRLTTDFARYVEDRIIDALRRYRNFDVDLAAVSEIDLCGVHLLGVLRAIGGAGVNIVASSPVVERALAEARGRGQAGHVGHDNNGRSWAAASF